jgi:protease-4
MEIMKSFFKYVFASALGFVVAGGILLVIFFGLLFGLVSEIDGQFGKKEKEFKVKDNTVYHLKFSGSIEERDSNDPFEDINFGPFSGESKMSLPNLVQSIEFAASDDKVKGIFMELSGFPGGLATLEEVRNALKKFKDSGKWIVTYSEGMTQGAYYLSSVSDEIYLYPEGDIYFKGLATKLMYVKGLLDKLDIEMQAIKGPNNIYKSAVEPLTSSEMSDANREQIQKYLSSIWGYWLEGISIERDLSVANLNVYADSLLIRNANKAMELGMVDGLMYKDQVMDLLVEKMELETEDDIEFVGYSKMKKKKVTTTKDFGAKKVAVIYANGEIREGKNSDGVMGSESIAEAIKTARKDTNIMAIVLRVNSPGGSALASDVMWRETVLAKAEKPLIVSMGDLAASGGYYISCNADRIFASPTTITGSIGVFGLVPVSEKFFNNKLGIVFHSEETNTHANFMDGISKLDDYEYDVVNSAIIHIYEDFLEKVAEGRGMTKEQVNEIARGRVWTGIDAQANGLVDEIGTLDDAIVYAASQAELEDYRIKELPEQKDPFQELLEGLQSEMSMKFMKDNFGSTFKYIQIVNEVENMKGIQARIPYNIEIY